MYCVCVEFTTHRESFETFKTRVRQQAAESLRHEAGCHVFDVWTHGDRPLQVMLYEVYENAQAFQDHLGSAHFRAFDAEVAAMIANKSVTIWDGKA